MINARDQKPGHDIEQSRGTVVAHVAGRELTGPVMLELVEELLQRLRCDNANHFVFDLAGVDHMDSACLGALVQFLQEVQHVRGRIALACCKPNVQFLFKVTKLDSVFTLYDDVAEACEQVLRG